VVNPSTFILPVSAKKSYQASLSIDFFKTNHPEIQLPTFKYYSADRISPSQFFHALDPPYFILFFVDDVTYE
jgi:hypothetical protein